MKLESQVTSLELSKRLKELGVKQESYFQWRCTESEENPPHWHIEYGRDDFHYPNYVSAFTVAELGEMLPESIEETEWTHILEIDHWDEGKWHIVYASAKGDYFAEVHAETEADARAKMLIYLIENNLIKN